MRLAAWAVRLSALGSLALACGIVTAQQVTVSTPYHSVSDSFFENMGTSWGLRGQNWSLNVFGSPVQAAPQFGGFDPSAGANLGFGINGRNVQGSFNANFSQGSRRSFTSQTPSVTLQNGVPGFVSDTSQSPFVISYIPVVGGFPTFGAFQPLPPQPAYAPQSLSGGTSAVLRALQQARVQQQRQRAGGAESVGEIRAGSAEPPVARVAEPAAAECQDDLVLRGPAAARRTAPDEPLDEASRKLAAARSSSAGQPAMSVAEARRLHAAEQAGETDEVLEYLERARGPEAAGKANVARIYYQMAYRRASGQLRRQIQTRLSALGTSSPTP